MPSGVQAAQTPSVVVIIFAFLLVIFVCACEGRAAKASSDGGLWDLGRAQSLLPLLTATTTTKAQDDESKDGAWNDPHHCWIRCHIGRRTIEATEEAEDKAIPPSAAATGEE